MEETDSRNERKTQLWRAVKERHDKATRDKQILMDEIERLESELKRALKKRMESLREQMWVKQEKTILIFRYKLGAV